MTNAHKFIVYACMALLLLINIAQCKQNADIRSTQEANAAAWNSKERSYKNKLGTITTEKQTALLTAKQLQELIIKKNDTLSKLAAPFKKVTAVTQIKSTTKIPVIAAKFETPITWTNSVHYIDSTGTGRPFEIDSSLYKFERSGRIKENWFSLNYQVTNDSLKISDFETNTGTTIITGIKQQGLFKPAVITTDVTFDNPYITVTGLKAAQVHVPVPWHKKWYVWLAAGVVAGAVTNAVIAH